MRALLALLMVSASIVMASENRYYWFSAKQLNVLKQGEAHGSTHRTYQASFIMVNGKRLLFTEKTMTKKPWGYWKDYRLVAFTDDANERFGPNQIGLFDMEWIENNPGAEIPQRLPRK